jgi:hypothetical protein
MMIPISSREEGRLPAPGTRYFSGSAAPWGILPRPAAGEATGRWSGHKAVHGFPAPGSAGSGSPVRGGKREEDYFAITVERRAPRKARAPK